MKSDLLDILACPSCPDAKLNLRAYKQEQGEIISGELGCSACHEIYFIQEGIPKMVPQPKEHLKGNIKDPEINLNLRHVEVREANTIFYDSVAEVYDNEKETEYRQGDLVQNRIEQMVKSLAEETQKDLFLDLGCGTGNVLKYGKKHFRRAVGIDISFNILRQAQRKNLEVVQADILFLPFRSSLFDVVSVFSVLHHIYDYHLVFNQISRVLKNEGYLYSDWDPAKKPSPEGRKISWGAYQLANKLYFLLRTIKGGIKSIVKEGAPDNDPIDFLSIRSDLKDVNAKAEFHNKTKAEKRGIDFQTIKNQLQLQGFGDIQAFYHEGGLTLNQLTGVSLLKSKFLTFLGFDPELFLENILILAKKTDSTVKEASSPSLQQCGNK